MIWGDQRVPPGSASCTDKQSTGSELTTNYIAIETPILNGLRNRCSNELPREHAQGHPSLSTFDLHCRAVATCPVPRQPADKDPLPILFCVADNDSLTTPGLVLEAARKAPRADPALPDQVAFDIYTGQSSNARSPIGQLDAPPAPDAPSPRPRSRSHHDDERTAAADVAGYGVIVTGGKTRSAWDSPTPRPSPNTKA